MIGNIYIIDKDCDAKGWYYCQETDEIYYHDGRSIRETIPTTEIFSEELCQEVESFWKRFIDPAGKFFGKQES